MAALRRLTSREFVESLNSVTLGTELALSRSCFSDTEKEVLAKQCLNVEASQELIAQLLAEGGVFSKVGSKIAIKNIKRSSLSDLSRLEHIMVHGSEQHFELALRHLNKLLALEHEKEASTPQAALRLLPTVEAEIVRRLRPSDSKVELECVIDSISRLKIANVTVFEAIIDSFLRKKDILLRCSSALSFLRELGWAGYTHSGFKHSVDPLFETFKNFQALTSVMIIAGGLTPCIVASCMRTFRADKGTKHAACVDSASQLIRRLVVCGFYAEAMEVFESFPTEKFLEMKKRNSISQIHRLFAASFIAPAIVTPSKVSRLRDLSANVELTSVAAHQSSGSSFIHNLAVNALNRLGVEHVSEFVDTESLLVIDIYVPALKLAIEVQGPSHYILDLADKSRKLRPEDEFKLEVLRARGYKIEQLSVFDFGRNHATRNADERIKEILIQHGWSSQPQNSIQKKIQS
jgi:hypothetical protein